eukprot:2295331-Ditylum_brightwellii.AAC.1
MDGNVGQKSPTSEAESNQLKAEEGFSCCGTLVTQFPSYPSLVHHHHTVTTKQSNKYIAISNRPLIGVSYSGNRNQGMTYQKEHISNER